MRVLRTASLLALTGGLLLADGEYARFHAGPMLGLSVSPDRSYRGFGADMPGQGTFRADGGAMLAPTVGFGMTYSFHPSSVRLGLDVDLIRPIGKEARDPTGSFTPAGGGTPVALSGVSVRQTAIRATGKFIWAFRPNTNPAWYFWFGPTVTQADTKATFTYTDPSTSASVTKSLSSGKETLTGGALGWGRRGDGEKSLGIFEFNLYYSKEGDFGTRAGGLTVEIRAGIHF